MCDYDHDYTHWALSVNMIMWVRSHDYDQWVWSCECDHEQKKFEKKSEIFSVTMLRARSLITISEHDHVIMKNFRSDYAQSTLTDYDQWTRSCDYEKI